jgi:hypothetical protein
MGKRRRRKRSRSRRRYREYDYDDDYDDDDQETDDSRRRKKTGSSLIKENIQFIVIGVAIMFLVAMVILISVFGGDSSGGDQPPPPGGWKDLTAFQIYLGNSVYDYNVISDTTKINSKAAGHRDKSLLIIIGVEEDFTGNEQVAVSDFVNAGGSVIIADDYNRVNDISGNYEVTYDGAQVLQYDGWYYNLSFIPVYAHIGDNSYNVILNAPTGFTTTGDAEIIAQASEDQVNIVLDKNENFKIEGPTDGDIWAPEIPFMVKAQKDSGSIVFMSDTGIFTDNLFLHTKFENQAFITKLISSLIPEDGYIYYDYSKQTSVYSGHVLLP